MFFKTQNKLQKRRVATMTTRIKELEQVNKILENENRMLKEYIDKQQESIDDLKLSVQDIQNEYIDAIEKAKKAEKGYKSLISDFKANKKKNKK